jgi:hypothetical protein
MKKFTLLCTCSFLICIALRVQAAPLLNVGDFLVGGQLASGQFNVATVGTAATVNNYPAAESPDHAIDGVGQKYLNFAETNTGFIVTPALGSTIANNIQVWTANDAEERDPASYELYGTNQTITGPGPFALSMFNLISSGGLTLPVTRQPGGATAVLDPANSQTVTFTNSVPYKSYMVVFPTVKNSATANSMQTGEVELDGNVVPEPGILGLLGLTMAGVLGLRRRR